MDSASSEGAPFKLTVVIPVYNEERTLREVLGALMAQPIPGDTEIMSWTTVRRTGLPRSSSASISSSSATPSTAGKVPPS